jgi:putative redox protein
VARIRVAHRYGASFEISIRGHRLVVDQPTTHGGDDQGPTPTELFVASLAACSAHYAQTYLARHGVSAGGVSVDSSFAWDAGGTRVERISLLLRLPAEVGEERRAAALRAASRCAVHMSLEHPPEVVLELAQAPEPESVEATGSPV